MRLGSSDDNPRQESLERKTSRVTEAARGEHEGEQQNSGTKLSERVRDKTMAQMVKSLPASAGDAGSVLRSGRSPGGGNSNPLQYSCLGNPMDRGAWWATVHTVTKSQKLMHSNK